MTVREELHQKQLAELAQNISWRNEAAVLLLMATAVEVGLYLINWNFLWLVLLFPWYWILRQVLHYQQEARLDWQFLHLMHPRFRDVDSVFHIPVPHSMEPLEFPPGFWTDKPVKKPKNARRKSAT